MARQEMNVSVQHKPDGTATAYVTTYALALLATNESHGGIQIVQEPCWTAAKSEDEAHDYGLQIAREKWPASDGWQHQVATRKVSLVIDLLKK